MAKLGDLGSSFRAEHPKVLLVEGDDEFYLLLQLLEEPEFEGHLIDVRTYEGVDKLGKALKTLGHNAPSGFRDHVTTLAVWRDADQEPAGALQSVKSALEAAGFAAPERSGEFAEGAPRVGMFVLPDGRSPGALENLCLASVRDTVPLPCVEAYVRCLSDADVELHPNPGKVRVHAYLASREEPGLKIGEAAKARHWDFSHEVWAPVKQFLHEM